MRFQRATRSQRRSKLVKTCPRSPRRTSARERNDGTRSSDRGTCLSSPSLTRGNLQIWPHRRHEGTNCINIGPIVALPSSRMDLGSSHASFRQKDALVFFIFNRVVTALANPTPSPTLSAQSWPSRPGPPPWPRLLRHRLLRHLRLPRQIRRSL